MFQVLKKISDFVLYYIDNIKQISIQHKGLS